MRSLAKPWGFQHLWLKTGQSVEQLPDLFPPEVCHVTRTKEILKRLASLARLRPLLEPMSQFDARSQEAWAANSIICVLLWIQWGIPPSRTL